MERRHPPGPGRGLREERNLNEGQKRATPQGVALSVCQRTLSRSEKLHSAGGARGGKARLESNRMPRTALPRKACGPRSGDFHTAEQWESNGIFRLSKSLTRLFRQPERTTLCGVVLFLASERVLSDLIAASFLSLPFRGGKSCAAPSAPPRPGSSPEGRADL